MSDLPPGWEWATLGEIASSVKNGIFVSRPGIQPDGVPILRISSVRSMRLDLDDIRYSGRSLEELREQDSLLLPGDILFTRYSGSREYVGVCARVPEGVGSLTYPDKLIRVRVPQWIDSRYLAAAFASPLIRHSVEKVLRTTAGQVGISGNSLKNVRIPIAPLSEQRRIVATLDDLLSRLGAGGKNLSNSVARLEVMKQAAFDAIASGSLLSDRKDAISGLADGWEWVRVDHVTSGQRSDVTIGPFGSNLKVSDYRDSGVPLVFVRNIRSNSYHGPKTRFVTPEKAQELAAHEVLPGDLLITKMGDPPGDASVYTGSSAAIITADCIRLRPSSGFRSDYLALSVNSRLVRDQIARITRGVAQKKVSLQRFRQEIKLPVPSRELQDRVMSRAGEMLDEITRMVSATEVLQHRAESLRRSLLTEAISGRLVLQDPGDEPASALLERIRAERSAQSNPKRSRLTKNANQEILL